MLQRPADRQQPVTKDGVGETVAPDADEAAAPTHTTLIEAA